MVLRAGRSRFTLSSLPGVTGKPYRRRLGQLHRSCWTTADSVGNGGYAMQRSGSYTVFSVPGWRSALTEAMPAPCSVPVRIEDVTDSDRPGAARDRPLRMNLLGAGASGPPLRHDRDVDIGL